MASASDIVPYKDCAASEHAANSTIHDVSHVYDPVVLPCPVDEDRVTYARRSDFCM